MLRKMTTDKIIEMKFCLHPIIDDDDDDDFRTKRTCSQSKLIATVFCVWHIEHNHSTSLIDVIEFSHSTTTIIITILNLLQVHKFLSLSLHNSFLKIIFYVYNFSSFLEFGKIISFFHRTLEGGGIVLF